ncbi:Ester hydrolase C11orf54 like protein [Argiope bruennichi]|uniref:Ester hydrolase C11orf54 like protein n=1 Tax=Argiope bruennichi TaxID=94029 RepID=A0A8T0FQ64_ARGBR|nr:Ester hydrolase C11orf54 like protein [Argiope bruennichi]
MYKIEEYKLFQPSLDEAAIVLQDGLSEIFSYVDVQVVNCPDLREKPYIFGAEGLCGNIMRGLGVYDFREISKNIRMPNAFIIGPGAGPRPHIGINCEMMANLKLGENENINTHVAKLDKDGACELVKLKDNTQFCLLGNLFISQGKPGKVLKVVAKNRKGSSNFVTTMREALANMFESPVGVGGVFVIKSGKAKLHIMPDYSETPLKSTEDVNNWLKFFNMPAPLSCLSVFVSSDPGLNLRVEHTHCFSDHGVGGHYHEDTTPEDVEYEGYFSLAETLYRIDQPYEVTDFGKD